MRFNPPSLELTPELVWVLLRAFGPANIVVPSGAPEKRWFLANNLSLGTRIAARHRPEVLANELGQPSADALAVALRSQVAQGLAILETERLCCEIAQLQDVNCVLLKFAALRRYGAVNVSTRASVDLDLLVNERDVETWSKALERAGAVRKAQWVPGYHPSVYRSPSGVNVEFHVRLPYLRTAPASHSVTLSELNTALLVTPADNEQPHVLLPRKDLLVAHLIAHGLVQHAYAPDAYPAFKLLGDMVDIGLGQDEALAMDSSRWLGKDLDSKDVDGLRHLARHAFEGTFMSLAGSGSAAEILLNHLLGSVMNASYRRQLRFRRLGQVLTEEGLFETLWHLGRAWRRDRKPQN